MTGRNALNVAAVCQTEVLRAGIVAIVEGDAELLVHSSHAHLDELTDDLQHGRAAPPDVVLVELAPPWEGLWSALRRGRVRYPNVGLLVLGTLTTHLAEGALEAGAHGVVDLSVSQTQLRKDLQVVGRGGLLDNAWMRAHLRSGRGRKRPVNTEVPTLTPQQAIVLRLMGRSDSPTYEAIAREMGIGERTVQTYRDQLFEKFKVKNRGALLYKARKQGLF